MARDADYHHFSLAAVAEAKAPLGWSLSDEIEGRIDDAVADLAGLDKLVSALRPSPPAPASEEPPPGE